ncbi:hypothetical protein ACFPRL_08140 [Pseudoclavibacter helvolus]
MVPFWCGLGAGGARRVGLSSVKREKHRRRWVKRAESGCRIAVGAVLPQADVERAFR